MGERRREWRASTLLRRGHGNTWTVVAPPMPQQRLALVERLIDVIEDGASEPALHALLLERARIAHVIVAEKESATALFERGATASTLAALFSGMAQLFQTATPAVPPESDRRSAGTRLLPTGPDGSRTGVKPPARAADTESRVRPG